jgi:phosphate transport system substrate-binding protein
MGEAASSTAGSRFIDHPREGDTLRVVLPGGLVARESLGGTSPTSRRVVQAMWRLLSATLLVLAIALGACSPRPERAQQAPATPPAKLRIAGSDTVVPLAKKLAEEYERQHSGARAEVASDITSRAAVGQVLEGTLDLILVTRPPAEAAGILEHRPFARDATVFAVNRPNPIQGLSTAQVQDIYGGRITDWQQLGGPAEPIILFHREEGQSAQEAFLSPLMNGHPVRANTVGLSKSREMIDALDSTPDSLGYASLSLIHLRHSENLGVLSLDGVMPGAESLAHGAYPWSVGYGLMYQPDAPPEVRRFVDFVRGPEGRRVLEAYGCAPAEE